MPARWRMTVRSLTRNRRRTVLTVAGVISSVCLVMVCSGMRDTVNSAIDRQYGEIERQDAQVLTAEGAADSSRTRYEPIPKSPPQRRSPG